MRSPARPPPSWPAIPCPSPTPSRSLSPASGSRASAMSASGSLASRPGLAVIGAVAAGIFVLMSPDCLGGPYGFLAPELKKVWLQTVTEAQPFQVYAAREPVGAFGSLMPLLLAVAVAVFHLRPGAGEKRSAWAVPAALLVMATAMSFYQT